MIAAAPSKSIDSIIDHRFRARTHNPHSTLYPRFDMGACECQDQASFDFTSNSPLQHARLKLSTFRATTKFDDMSQ